MTDIQRFDFFHKGNNIGNLVDQQRKCIASGR